ncbi:MAG: protein-disulfide reductase DsbD family protein [Acidobacteriota bacterium]
MKSLPCRLSFSIYFLLAGIALAQQDVVRYRLTVPEQAIAGGTFTAILHAEIQEGWHLYALTKYPRGVPAPQPTTIVIPPNSVFRGVDPVQQPAPKVSFDPNFEINTEYFEKNADFKIPIRVSSSTAAGEYSLSLKVRYMACNDRLCLPPQTKALSADVSVAAAAAGSSSVRLRSAQSLTSLAKPPAKAGTGLTGPPSQSSGEAVQERGSQDGVGSDPPPANSSQIPTGTIAYIGFAMLMGALALLTPCVFPMIPITVSYFTKREVGRKRALSEAGIYAAGIILTFTLLGFLLTFLFGVGGLNRVATNPAVNVLIALIFVLFALSLFGVIEIRLPSSWLSAVDKKSSASGGIVGILLMALTFSLTSFTCTVPFVGTLMVAATQGDWLWASLGITAFATVFAIPFFFLALFPSLLKSLPKSGNWMNSVKITMGFLELAAAMKFISNVDLVYQWELVTRPVFTTIWLALALMTSLYLLGGFHFPHEVPSGSVGAGRVLSSTFFLAVSFYLLRGLFGFPLGELDAFLPPKDYGAVASPATLDGTRGTGAESERWLTSYSQALARARIEDRPILIDFTGYTCTNCRWMESNIFVRPRVEALFRRFVLVRLYTDGGKPEHAENLEFERERFGTIALPFYAILNPKDQIVATFPGLTRNAGKFVSFLEKGFSPGQNVVAKADSFKPTP